MIDLKLRTYRCGSPRQSGEGLRVGAVRYLPRGVRKEKYAKRDYFDLWLPILAPSQKLLHWFKSRTGDPQKLFEQYRQRYVKEMKATDARQVILLLAKIAEKQPIGIGCYCEDKNFCHRSILLELVRNAARDLVNLDRPAECDQA